VTQTREPRPDRPEVGPFVHNDLAKEIERLKTEAAWHDGDRNAITVAKRVGLTLVLTILRRKGTKAMAPRQVRWRTTVEEARKAAREHGKLVLVDMFNPG
jgi:hypothetical protein